MSLFDIPTTVQANRIEGEIASVGVIADRETREEVYRLAHLEALCPIARCKGLTPTTLLFTPYEGYTGQMTASLVYALVCLARVGWTAQLFCSSVTDISGNHVSFQDFVPEIEVVREVQKRFVHHYSTDCLITAASRLRADFRSASMIAWRDEAVECERRLPSPNLKVTELVTEMAKLTEAVLSAEKISQKKAAEIDLEIESYTKTTRQLSHTEYFRISDSILAERLRLIEEMVRINEILSRVQRELMIEIRRLTPAK